MVTAPAPGPAAVPWQPSRRPGREQSSGLQPRCQSVHAVGPRGSLRRCLVTGGL